MLLIDLCVRCNLPLQGQEAERADRRPQRQSLLRCANRFLLQCPIVLTFRRDKKLKKLIGEDDGTEKHVALYKVRLPAECVGCFFFS